MRSFSKLHPTVLFLYFVMSLAAVLSFNNPFISAFSLFGAVAFSFFVFGRSALKRAGFSVFVILFVAVFNFLFAHYGEDVLFTLKDTVFTAEALFYGFNQGVVLASALLWFSIMGQCLDSEKIIYLFRFMPKTALLFSMILGFIPRFLKKQKEIREARLALNAGKSPEGVKNKLSAALGDLSALTSYALEGSIITADSMNARAYNPSVIRKGRYKYKSEDIALLTISLLLFGFVLFQKIIGNLSFVFEPKIYIARLSVPAAVCFFVFALIPSINDLTENVRWMLYRSGA